MKRGFTLIELLAVIVILAIVALISTPMILNVIDEATKGAFKDAAYGIVEAGELGYTQDVLNGTVEEVTYTYTNGTETSEPSGRILNYRGTKPQNGTVIVNTEGKVALAIHNGSKCAQKGFAENEVYLSNKTADECIITGDGNIIGGDGGTSDGGGTSGGDSGGDIVNSTPPADPELASNMIPVRWDEINQVWVKADVNNVAGDNQWYDYTNKKWANAVTVEDANRTTYQNAAVGTTIPMTDINVMLVWIPRYKYAIPTGTGARQIDVVFEDKTTPKSTGTAIDADYYTHPGFTFGGTELNGLWVGKFTATGTTSYITTKPNETMLIQASVSTKFNASRDMQTTGNEYGFSTTGVNTHMMKNTEWAAAAYLSHSQYGKVDEVWINPNSNLITGCAGDGVDAVSTTSCNQYHTTNGKNASTSGTVYGVYDMNGGVWENVMANYSDLIRNDGFTEMPESQYYDLYSSWGVGSACGGQECIGGHALWETQGWYGDYDNFFDYTYSWIERGGSYDRGSTAGVFSFSKTVGSPVERSGFRIVLTIN